MSVYQAKSPTDLYVPEARWIAFLSNGETIYEDIHPKLYSSWTRLKEYVEANALSIDRVRWEYKGKHSEVKLGTGRGFAIIKKARTVKN